MWEITGPLIALVAAGLAGYFEWKVLGKFLPVAVIAGQVVSFIVTVAFLFSASGHDAGFIGWFTAHPLLTYLTMIFGGLFIGNSVGEVL